MKTILRVPREFLQYPYHFGAFFILAVLFRRCLSWREKAGDWRAATISLIGCAVVSIVSEVLQMYVPTRTPALRDLAVDQSGATLAVTLMRRFSTKLFRLG
jgi:VanZ family protein